MKLKVNVDGEWVLGEDLPLKTLAVNERLKRSLKVFFIFFLMAVLSILIPVLHFVLVPGFLIASVVLSILKYKEIGIIDLSNFSCPSCKKKMHEKTISFKKSDETLRLFCSECRKNIVLFLLETNGS